MATSSKKANFVDLQSWKNKESLKEYLLCEAHEPLVFEGCLERLWPGSRDWSHIRLCEMLGARETAFKVCPRRGSREHRRRFGERDTVFETRCEFVTATFDDFAEWLKLSEREEQENKLKPSANKKAKLSEAPHRELSRTEKSSSNPLLSYSPCDYWIYADYKYMIELCRDLPGLMNTIDWGHFGFKGRGGVDSTLWVGSSEAYTPCHYDTYGCNLVAQVYGRKKWMLFPPSDSDALYPTRIPYEESSVFSEVNVACPDLERHGKFHSATCYQVELEAGDVLFVPAKWWHYVESQEPSLSINTWIPIESDGRERVKEAVVRTTIAGWLGEAQEEEEMASPSSTTIPPSLLPPDSWVNPNEEIFSHEKNLELLTMTLSEIQATPTEKKPRPPISSYEWLKVLTSERVVDAIASELIQKHS